VSRLVKTLSVSVLVLLLLFFGGTLTYFLAQNSEWVVVRYPTVQLDWSDPLPTVEYESPLALVMAISIVMGFVIAVVLFFPSWFRRAWERRRERRFINSLEGELTDLRNLPVDHPAPLEDLPETSTRRRPAPADSGTDEDAALLAAALREADEER